MRLTIRLANQMLSGVQARKSRLGFVGVSTIAFPNSHPPHSQQFVVQIRLREYLAHSAAPARQNLLLTISLSLFLQSTNI
jgi:hypothetical protein